MNNQEAFDIMVQHLRNQGKQSRLVNSTICAYRTSDGLKCAVGALIPDEMYSNKMEMIGIYNLVVNSNDFSELGELFTNINLELLSEMQNIHDSIVRPDRWERRFRLLAKKYGLKYTPPETSK
jgi:hypothetical protein